MANENKKLSSGLNEKQSRVRKKSKIKRVIMSFLCFALVLLLGGEVIFSAFSIKASAATSSLDTTDPLDDLEGSVIEGVPFDLKNYNFDVKKSTQVIAMIESGYSFKGYDDLELYVYVYNPKALTFDVTGSNNSITLFAGDVETAPYTKIPLEFVKASGDADYYGLFYKFRVALTEEHKAAIFPLLNSSARYYAVGEAELYHGGMCELVGVGGNYTYSGYMQGYGSNPLAESTLTCSAGWQDTISLETKSTYYRTGSLKNAEEQIGGKNTIIDCEDTLHSVYFAVENSYIAKYGNMTRVRGNYVDALTLPMLCIGDEEIYNATLPVVGRYIGTNYDKDVLKYRFFSGYDRYFDTDTDTSFIYAGYVFNRGGQLFSHNVIASKTIDTLQLLFKPAEWGIDAADAKKLVSAEIIKEALQAPSFGEGVYRSSSGAFYYEKYFEYISSERIPFDVDSDTKFSLVGQEVKEHWWNKLGFAGGEEISNLFEGKEIEGIRQITDADIAGSDLEISQRLFIAESDVTGFKDYYNASKAADKTVYLMRYRVTDYYAEEVSITDGGALWGAVENVQSTNACFAQMHVALGFEIIDLTFTKDGKETVIPVVMRPIDIIDDMTGAVNTVSDEEQTWEFFAKLIFGVAVIIVLAIVLGPFLGSFLTLIVQGFGLLLKLLLSIVTAPLRWLWRLLFPK